MTQNKSPITKIQTVYNENDENHEFDLGADFSNVYLNNTTFSLKDFFNHYKNFLEDGTFIMYSHNEPQSEQIKLWYETSWEQVKEFLLGETDIVSRIKSNGEIVIDQIIDKTTLPAIVQTPFEIDSTDKISSVICRPVQVPGQDSSTVLDFANYELIDTTHIKISLQEESSFEGSNTEVTITYFTD